MLNVAVTDRCCLFVQKKNCFNSFAILPSTCTDKMHAVF